MGTILQEIGHDAVIVAFLDRVLKPAFPGAFYIVTPAIGPKRDIYYFDAKTGRYQSAWNASKDDYIPEFYYRMTLSKGAIEEMTAESGYASQRWYAELSKRVGHDLREFLRGKILNLESLLKSDLPDLVGFNERGELSVFAEIKFEGFSAKAKDSVLEEFDLSRKLDVPYYLTMPKRPAYGSELTATWIRNNLPREVRTYKFSMPKTAVIPKQKDIVYEAVK